MIRQIIGWRRIDGEDWRETMNSMNERIDRGMSLHFCMPWDMEICRNQWLFGQYVCEANAMAPWKLIALWNPRVIIDDSLPYLAYRRPGHPRTKWDQGLQNFAKFKTGNSDWINFMN
eukprot:12398079-Karenia_brevis.AAC.1